MRKWTKSLVIQQYISSCAIIQSATVAGDYKTSNKERPKLIAAYKWLEKNICEANEVLGELLQNESPVVQTKAAAHCLCLNVNKNEAISILRSVSKRNDIWGFNAQQTLEAYKKESSLRAY